MRKNKITDSITSDEEYNLLTSEEAAEYIGVPVGTLRAFCSQRRLPYFKIGKRLVLNLKDLNAFIRSRRVEAQHTN